MSARSRHLRMFALVLTSDFGQRRVIGSAANQLRYQDDGARARYDVTQ